MYNTYLLLILLVSYSFHTLNKIPGVGANYKIMIGAVSYKRVPAAAAAAVAPGITC